MARAVIVVSAFDGAVSIGGASVFSGAVYIVGAVFLWVAVVGLRLVIGTFALHSAIVSTEDLSLGCLACDVCCSGRCHIRGGLHSFAS